MTIRIGEERGVVRDVPYRCLLYPMTYVTGTGVGYLE